MIGKAVPTNMSEPASLSAAFASIEIVANLSVFIILNPLPLTILLGVSKGSPPVGETIIKCVPTKSSVMGDTSADVTGIGTLTGKYSSKEGCVPFAPVNFNTSIY